MTDSRFLSRGMLSSSVTVTPNIFYVATKLQKAEAVINFQVYTIATPGGELPHRDQQRGMRVCCACADW